MSCGVCRGQKFPDPRPGCHTGCRSRCNLMMCVRLWVCRCKRGLSSHRVSLKLSSDACSVVVRVCRCKSGLPQRVSLEVSSDARTGQDSQYYFYTVFFSVWIYFISVFWFVSCPEIDFCKKMYLVNRLETNCRISLTLFDAIGAYVAGIIVN